MNKCEHDKGVLVGTEQVDHTDEEGEVFMITCTELRQCGKCGNEFAVEFDVRPEDYQYWLNDTESENWKARE